MPGRGRLELLRTGALFDIANNFAIRHNNEMQKREYDILWLTWIFYVYLAIIHLLLRVGQTAATKEPTHAA